MNGNEWNVERETRLVSRRARVECVVEKEGRYHESANC